jgi:hypothetical protein
VRSAAIFAIPFTAIAFFRVTVAVVRGSAPFHYVVIVPLLGFALFFLGAFTLQPSGAVTRNPSNHLQLDVNPWFAWLLCGAIVFFFVGLLARGHNVLAEDYVRVGLLSALAWMGFVSVAWLASRLFLKRGA